MNEYTPSIVSIDEHHLDKECIRLPSDYLKWSTQSAAKKWEVDRLKAKLEVVQAEIAAAIRRAPEAHGLEKITEASLSAAVLLQERYQKVQARLIDARHDQELTQAVVWALEAKKRSLTLLVELHGMGYFSSPKISEQGREAVERMTKERVRRRHNDD